MKTLYHIYRSLRHYSLAIVAVLTIAACANSAAQNEIITSFTLTKPTTKTINLRQYKGIKNKWVRITNTGKTTLNDPWIVVNGKRDWFDTKSIIKDAVGNETDSEKRAFALWRFVQENSYHWYPPHDKIALHDPVKFFNTYGYGFCDDAAQVMCALAQNVGFRNQRIRALPEHVVSEIFYNNAWHLIDADVRVFYPDKATNRGAKSLEEIQEDKSLISRVQPHGFVSVYSKKAKQANTAGWRTSCTMHMALRPGESILRNFDNNGKFIFKKNFYPASENITPPRYAYGVQIYPDPLTIALPQNDNTTTQNGTIKMTTPYVYLDGFTDMNLELKGKATATFVGYTNSRKRPLATVTAPYNGHYRLDLSKLIDRTTGTECNTATIQITLAKSARTDTASITNIITTAEFQCSPHALPTLLPRQINSIETRFKPADGAELTAEFAFEEDPTAITFEPAKPIFPQNNDTINTDAPLLQWTSAPDTNTTVCRQVIVSWDKEGILPIAPNTMTMDNISTAPQFTVPAGWLRPGNTYHWRVREIPYPTDAIDVPWSGPWTFTVAPK